MITSKQREGRKQGIFASDVSRIMRGQSVQLVLEKLGEIEPQNFDDVIEVELGEHVEPRILDAYQEARPDLVLERRPEALEFFHPIHDWLGCHPDAGSLCRTMNVEAKAIGDYNRNEWGDGGDEVPDKVLWQVSAQMTVTQLPVTEIPVCFMTPRNLKLLLLGKLPELIIYEVPADADLQHYIIERSAKIWECVQTRELPPAESLEDVRLIYKRDTGEALQADEATFQAYEQLVKAQAEIKGWQAVEEDQKLIIQSFMKDASELRWEGQALHTWKRSKDTERVDLEKFANSYPDVYKDCLKASPGSRRFLTKKLKK